MERLLKVFRDNEPELVLVKYQKGEAAFQLLDCDSCRIGTMVCTGVRVICVGTAFDAYERMDVYTLQSLPTRLGWMADGLIHDRQWMFLVMPSKHHPDGAAQSPLPRMNGYPHGFIVCENAFYREEGAPGFGPLRT
jgi:hypothetical protein